MHILHLKDTLEVGGISAVLHTLINTAQQSHPSVRHTVATFSPGPFAEKIANSGPPTSGGDTHKNNVPVHHIETCSYRAVAKKVSELRPDVIHVLGFTMLRYARLLHRLTGIPVVCGIHGDLNKIGRLQRHIQGFLMKVMGNWCSSYICVSEEVRRILLTKLPRSFPRKKTVVIPNGITLETIVSDKDITRTGVGLPEDTFIIGSVGRLAREKSYDLLLRSAAPLCREKKVIICLVGDGPEHGRLVRLAHDLNIADEVFFMGQQTPAAPWYFLFDCFVLSSQTEGLSISLLEAMQAGLPVVSTHKEDLTHPVITDNVSGLLAPLNNEAMLCKTLEKVIDDAALRARLKKEALNCVQKFSAQKMSDKYMAVFATSVARVLQ